MNVTWRVTCAVCKQWMDVDVKKKIPKTCPLCKGKEVKPPKDKTPFARQHTFG